MFEANTTFLGRISHGIGYVVSSILSASSSPFSVFIGTNISCANEVSASKQNSQLSVDAHAVCCFTQQARVCNSSINQLLSLSCIRSTLLHPDRSEDNFNHIHADMGSSISVPAFCSFEKHIPAVVFSIN